MTETTKKPQYSLIRTIKIFLVLVVAVVSLSVGGAVSYYFSQQSEREYLDSLTNYSDYLVSTLELPLWDMEKDLVKMICNTFSAHQNLPFLSFGTRKTRCYATNKAVLRYPS